MAVRLKLCGQALTHLCRHRYLQTFHSVVWLTRKEKLSDVSLEAVPKYSPSIFLVKLIHFHSTANPANGGFEREPAGQRTLLAHGWLARGSASWNAWLPLINETKGRHHCRRHIRHNAGKVPLKAQIVFWLAHMHSTAITCHDFAEESKYYCLACAY